MPKITNEDSYLAQFPVGGTDNARARALHVALDIRKFEIELYWKRATYFWTLIAAAFAGFLLLQTRAEDNTEKAEYDAEGVLLVLLLASIGLVLSLAWFLANRGSKYWQENWERHVDLLEDEVMGPLYKTTLSRDGLKWFDPRSAYPYSVTRINQLVSLFVTLVWFGLFGVSIVEWQPARDAPSAGIVFLLVLTAVAVVSLLTLGVGSVQTERPKVEFNQRISDDE